ncbi:MAG: hypothetical protein QOF67_260 [Mycobacterium sp.]|nr:hypothetical protein [Mycobacterium sp.]
MTHAVVAKYVLKVARLISAVVAFGATLLGIVFVLWPWLKPEGPPETRGAILNEFTLEPKVTFGQYLDRIELSRAPYKPYQLVRRGVLVEFNVVITGYDGKRLPIRWQLIDEDSGEQLDESRDLLIVPGALTDQNSWPVWVPRPTGREPHLFVKVTLYDPNGVPIARGRTHLFANAELTRSLFMPGSSRAQSRGEASTPAARSTSPGLS